MAFGWFCRARREAEIELSNTVLRHIMCDVLMGWAHGDEAAQRRAAFWLDALLAHETAAVAAFIVALRRERRA